MHYIFWQTNIFYCDQRTETNIDSVVSAAWKYLEKIEYIINRNTININFDTDYYFKGSEVFNKSYTFLFYNFIY